MRFTSTDAPFLVIIGPSGAGKSSVVRRLFTESIIMVNPSWTTRPPRPDENEESAEHVFVSEHEFKAKEAAGYFLESVQLFGLPYYYGLAAIVPTIDGKVSTVILRASLLPLLSKHYQQYIVYQIEDSRDRVEDRLNARESNGEPVGGRLTEYDKEIALGKQYAHRSFVNSGAIDELYEQIRQAIQEDFAV